jgi:AcrR family transcriptional regulator
MTHLKQKPRSEAAEQIKLAACRLFALRGVDGVTVRDIADAAGQRNHASVGYHFGSKEGLIRELVIDGAALIDGRRALWLDRLEATGGPRSVREVMDIIVQSTVDMAGPGQEDSYTRFVVMLQMTHPAFFMEVLGGRWNAAYLRCLGHLRRLMPDMPEAAKSQRLLFMVAALGAVMAARESALSDGSRAHPTWNARDTLADFANAMTALLQAPREAPLASDDASRLQDDRLSISAD